ncbi:MAG TPA: flagellar biosynthetic protein FliO [Solirubrobacteraceae bacterium]|jgi:flagellar protein FliO/FliZ|nr:flagellar biosynthetic protein FliO [Solirubrobacteraceae bacterium]
MTKLTLPRAATQAAALLYCCLLAWADPASAFTAANTKKGAGEETPLNLGAPSTGSHPSSGSGGASIVRTIVGLAIVLAVIWGLAWILRQVKGRRDPRVAEHGLTSVAALSLSSGRSVHLVRAGNDYLLLGSAEHGLMPIHRYTEQQALEAGLLSPEEPPRRPKRRINLGLLASPNQQDRNRQAPLPKGGGWPNQGEVDSWPEPSRTARPVSAPIAALPQSTTIGPRPTRALESGERQSDPMHMPSVSSSLIERLRELTVRR